MTRLYSATVLGSSLYLISWLFVCYSLIGVVVEGVFFWTQERVLESRIGLLYLPLRPLYGVGGLGYAVLLRGLAAQPVLVFVLGALVATVVEYLASLLGEKVFAAVSWDYSDKRFNWHGRVCLQYSVAWGLLALVALYLVAQPAQSLLRTPAGRTGEIVLTVVLASVLLSAVITCAALARTRTRVVALRARAAGEAAADGHSRWSRLVAGLVPDLVLINSFPRMSLVVELAELTGQRRAWVRFFPRSGLRRLVPHRPAPSSGTVHQTRSPRP